MRVFQVMWDYIQGSLLTTLGDIVKRGAAVNERMALGGPKEMIGVNDMGDDLVYRDGIELASVKGDLLKRGVDHCVRLPVGGAKKVLGVNNAGDDLEYRDGIEIATVQGDILKRGAAAVEKLAIGTKYEVLQVNSSEDDVSYQENQIIFVSGLNVHTVVKVLEIGDWDMDLTTTVGVAHGLTLANIIGFSVVIREDESGDLYNGGCSYLGDQTTSLSTIINDTNVLLSRLLTGAFDNTLFDETPYNRGFITIWYKV